MPTRNVVLTDHQEQLIASLIASGTYQNASEVIRDGLRHVERQKKYDDWLRAEVQKGIDDIEAGRSKTFDDVEDLVAYLEASANEVMPQETRPPEARL